MRPVKPLPFGPCLAALLLLMLGQPLVLTAADPSAAAIDAVFADYDTTSSPGCSLGVMRDGKLIYRRGYGMANLEYGIALSPRSVFRTGSVGKQFTAMVMALLAEQKVIDLEDPLSKFFPEFPAWADRITVRHLIHHTSGLRDYLELTWLAGLDDDAHFTDEDVIALLARQKHTNFPPGDQYLYSNSGYFLMSHIVLRTTGKSLRQWAAENVFGPLGMDDTHYHDDHTEIVPGRADGYSPAEDGYRISMTTLDMVGDGGVFTTIEDLLSWDRNFYDNRLGAGKPGLIDRVTTPGALNDGEALDYAFGLRVRPYRGLRTIGHGGSFVGFRAEMIRFPDARLSVATLCNRSDADPGQRARRVAELYLEGAMAAGPTTALAGRVPPVEVPVARLAALAGHYWDADNRAVREVRLEEKKLFLLRGAEDRTELAPLGGDRFLVVGAPGAVEVRFERSTQGGHRMRVLYEDEPPEAFESFTRRTPTAEEVASYAGAYYSDELDVRYVLEARGSALFFGFNRPGDHPLQAQFGEIFTNPDYGTLEFERAADGAIAGFSLDAGRVRGLAFVRR